MSDLKGSDRDRITIAILALGGQGGGVLADWIAQLAETQGYVAQGTSVPGVAQRTGSTVYYVEMVRKAEPGANRPEPVLALMPVPGDVDVVLASELMEAGRSMVRGFVSKDRTTLITSTHRIFAISEKSALGDGTASSGRILDAAQARAARFVGFDMDAAATQAGSVISSVMFGALAGSGALPFPAEAFEAAIRGGGKAVEANLKGFAAGYDGATRPVEEDEEAKAPLEPTTQAGRRLAARIAEGLPPAARSVALEGVRRLMDYQDAEYATLYLDRLARVRALDSGWMNYRLTTTAARRLALWMAYEDTVRVADLKLRATRFARIADEVRLGKGQLLHVTEYMHPRLQEVCETLPAWLGAPILRNARLRGWFQPLFARGRHVETTSLRWFLALRLIASLRPLRRSTLRYRDEQTRIEAWLKLAREAAATNVPLATEILELQELIKGYSDTFERGLRNYQSIADVVRDFMGSSDAAERVRALRTAALADERGDALRGLLACAGPAAA
ncbi:MAG TPA: indolepyruvate oxidoreductase subunit beta family protein [Phenylobacterium sp.]|uniref:indolepyruvate oxidoreductase subunit beta family protein n=1 Tax=Phenylobacterium sp. TaxID=1871053 RepID=UPI002B48C2F1|nr:indolepyruvate oxidoreductase subunit beta family protein [Phenylobacterium sp.]HKR90410.1 indolepyruvate oxidoreductase subunit beta family protein [Phenylobacterium sp.]